MKIVSRSGWAARPAHRFTPSDPRTLEGVCVHWFGSPRAAKRHSGCPALLRSVQQGHLNHPTENYADIAYNMAVCPHGVVYELRGFHRRSGANGTGLANLRYASVVVMMGEGDRLTGEAKDSLRDVIAEYRRRGAGRKVIRHGEITGSECPGPELAVWVNARAYDHDPGAALRKRTGYWAWLAWYEGREDWKPFGARNRRVRPDVPKTIAAAWWVRRKLWIGRQK